jgi:hypothetical protein
MDPLGRLDVEAGKAMTERFQFGLPTVFGVTTIVAVLLWGLLTVPAVLGDIASLLAVVWYLLVMFVESRVKALRVLVRNGSSVRVVLTQPHRLPISNAE